MSPVVELSDIEFTYPSSSQPTLKLPSLTAARGEKLFIHGPSGCGKTTLLEILAGVLVPQKGRATLLGTDLVQASPPARDRFRAAHVGYIFQSFNLIPYLNVDENISLPLHLSQARRAKVPAGDEKKEIHRLCANLGVESLLGKPVAELSVGQQQRVAAARALLGSPEIVLADEPTSALDYDHREKFVKLLFDVAAAANTTILFVSHDRTLEKLFDRTVSLAELNEARTR